MDSSLQLGGQRSLPVVTSELREEKGPVPGELGARRRQVASQLEQMFCLGPAQQEKYAEVPKKRKKYAEKSITPIKHFRVCSLRTKLPEEAKNAIMENRNEREATALFEPRSTVTCYQSLQCFPVECIIQDGVSVFIPVSPFPFNLKQLNIFSVFLQLDIFFCLS